MFSKIKYLGIAALLSSAFYSCSNDIAAPESSSGSADFARYVAVGNSITSGYTSSGMTKATQDNSLANLLANQFKLAGGGDFKQPTMTDNGSGVLQLQGLNAVPPCNIDTKPVIARSEVDANWIANISAQGPFNNLAVPGMSIKASQTPASNITPSNGFFNRMLANTVTSYKDFVSESVSTINPTFYSLWLGNNDALSYSATGGGWLPNFSTNPAGDMTGPEIDLSSPGQLLAPPNDDEFREKYVALLDVLTANGAKGVVATIPDITALPYFTTVSDSVTNPSSCTQKLAVWITARISATSSDSEVRPATANDYILLPAGSTIGRMDDFGGNIIPHGLSEYNPLRNAEVLDQQEAAFIRGKVTLFNNIIKEEALARTIPVADMYTFLNNIKDGAVYDGVAVSSAFISGGAFSLDGIHPTDRGYAIVANEFIRTINEAYGASVPLVDVTKFKGVTFP